MIDLSYLIYKQRTSLIYCNKIKTLKSKPLLLRAMLNLFFLSTYSWWIKYSNNTPARARQYPTMLKLKFWLTLLEIFSLFKRVKMKEVMSGIHWKQTKLKLLTSCIPWMPEFCNFPTPPWALAAHGASQSFIWVFGCTKAQKEQEQDLKHCPTSTPSCLIELLYQWDSSEVQEGYRWGHFHI